AMWVAVGGRGTIVGAALGAILVNGAKSYFSESFPDGWLYFLGALFISVVLLFPGGLVGVWERWGSRREKRESRLREKASHLAGKSWLERSSIWKM
ncbi:MAG TPA: hypothetical protein VEH09_03955, partial [Thermodesulfobacteriota bacterium]|nr:hypothetical protein [Thermodesulfobacteriota bacterium]